MINPRILFMMALVLIPWTAVISDSFWGSHSDFSGYIVMAATWVIDLVIPGKLSDHQGFYVTLLFMFPVFFVMSPIHICKSFIRHLLARRASR